MKKFFCAFIMIIAMALGACSIADMGMVGADAAGSEKTGMGSVYIISESEPGEDYQHAECYLFQEGEAANGDDTELAVAGKLCDMSGSVYDNVAERNDIEIKLRGNSSKESAKKAYTVKFEDEQALLGMEPGRKWALVSNPFDKSLLRPVVGLAYAEDLGLDYVSQARLCHLWMNGKYMGVYTAMEPVEAGQTRVGIEPENGDFLLERNVGRQEDDVVYIDSPSGMRFEFNEPEEPDEGMQAKCFQMLADVEEAVFSGDHEQYARLIDVESFANFYIFQELIKDVDFGEYSTRYYFKDGVMYAGPPWDLDLTMGNVSAEKDEFKYASYNNAEGAGDDTDDSSRGLWASGGDYYYWLCRDPWFMELVQQRWAAMREFTENLAVDNDLGRSVIDGYLDTYRSDLERNFKDGGKVSAGTAKSMESSVAENGGAASNKAINCWNVSEPAHMSEWQQPAETYLENVEMLRLWLVKRANYLDSQWGPFVYTPALAIL